MIIDHQPPGSFLFSDTAPKRINVQILLRLSTHLHHFQWLEALTSLFMCAYVEVDASRLRSTGSTEQLRTVLWMLKNHMIVDYLIFVVRNCSDDATGFLPLVSWRLGSRSSMGGRGRLRERYHVLLTFCISQKDASRLRSTGSTVQFMSYCAVNG